MLQLMQGCLMQVFTVKSVEDPINVAYSSLGLPFHMDLVYYQSSPGLQLLYCVKYASVMFRLFYHDNIMILNFPS